MTYAKYAAKESYLRNKFHFSEGHGSMNAMGPRDPLRSYFHDPQKNETHLLYLHYFRNNFHQLKST